MKVKITHTKPVGCNEGMIPPGEIGTMDSDSAKRLQKLGRVEVIDGRSKRARTKKQAKPKLLEGNDLRRVHTDDDGVSGPREQAVRGDKATGAERGTGGQQAPAKLESGPYEAA